MTTTTSVEINSSVLDALHADITAYISAKFAALKSLPSAPTLPDAYAKPTAEDFADKRNKVGAFLTERGGELCFRLFDDGAGYNRVSKALHISQGGAKNRKAMWVEAGGLNRTRLKLDIDA